MYIDYIIKIHQLFNYCKKRILAYNRDRMKYILKFGFMLTPTSIKLTSIKLTYKTKTILIYKKMLGL